MNNHTNSSTKIALSSREKLTPKQRTKLLKASLTNYPALRDRAASYATEAAPDGSKPLKQFYSKDGQPLKLVNGAFSRNQRHILVEFPDGVQVTVPHSTLYANAVRHPMKATRAGTGYRGPDLPENFCRAGALRWEQLHSMAGKPISGSPTGKTRKPVDPAWNDLTAFNAWWQPRWNLAQSHKAKTTFHLESDLIALVENKPAQYGPHSCLLVPAAINHDLAKLCVYAEKVKGYLTGEVDILPKGVARNASAGITVTFEGRRWATYNTSDRLSDELAGIELLTRLKLYKLLQTVAEYDKVLDPQVKQYIYALYDVLFGGLKTPIAKVA